MSDGVIVLKFGGSVLREAGDLGAASAEVQRFLARWLGVVAVVSALEGETDRLTAEARAIGGGVDEGALAMLLATGEQRSAALLALSLQARGVRAAALGEHTVGLRTKGPGIDADPASLDAWTLTRAVSVHRAVVVPGFVGVGPSKEVTLLGRGGSDLTALFIAAQLRARCRLVKDVAGLYERDPAIPGPAPRRYRTLGWTEALGLDGGIVQHKGVRFAQRHGLTFEVGAIGREDVTVVGHGGVNWYEDAKEVARAG